MAAITGIATLAIVYRCLLSGKPDIGADLAPRRLLTPTGHERPAFAAMHGPDVLYLVP